MEKLYIPKKIKVGYQDRKDTYTQKLAYVIYYDDKGVLRKETSWEGWRHKKIDPSDFDNVPTEGFVLNKKAGGDRWGWNPRQTYCRVYDPRGFEFEITIPNLLFILQECNAMKGKGLEGEFVYAWQGKDLVLLPAGCEEYKKSTEFTQLQGKKLSAKELVPGCSVMTKRQDKLIYLGKHDWFEFTGYSYNRHSSHSAQVMYKTSKQYIFIDEDNNLKPLSSLTSLATMISDTPVSNYAELFDIFSKSLNASKPKGIVVEKIDTSKLEVVESHGGYYQHLTGDGLGSNQSSALIDLGNNTFQTLHFSSEKAYDSTTQTYSHRGFSIQRSNQYNYDDKTGVITRISHQYTYSYNRVEEGVKYIANLLGITKAPRETFSLEEVKQLPLVKVSLEFENGAKRNIINI